MTPKAKKSTGKECCSLVITSGDMYPGVPDVSFWLSGESILAIPISVNLKYPLASKMRFSGLISR